MMRRFSGPGFLLAACCIALLLLTGCSGISTPKKIVPSAFQVAGRFELPFNVDKCLFDRITGTWYLQQLDAPNIMFYRNGAQINAIGGLGNDHANFQRLSDIAIDSDGNLLAMDGFARLVKKFSPDGKWLADISLPDFKQPDKLCATPENNLIIYDSSVKELKCVSGLDGRILFTFGRFQVQSVSSITANSEVIAVASAIDPLTVMFSSIGMYLKEYPAKSVVDQYLNQYYYQEGALHLADTSLKLPMGWDGRFTRLFCSGQTLLLVKDNKVATLNPVFGNQ